MAEIMNKEGFEKIRERVVPLGRNIKFSPGKRHAWNIWN